MVLGRGQSVGRPQVVGHERRLRHVVAREVVVVHREQDDVFEIEVAGFEDAHDLHPFERLALVGDAHGLQMATQQRGVNLRRQLDVALVQRIAEFGNLLRNHGQKLHALTPVVALVGRPGHGGQLLRTLHVVVRHVPARRELHDVLAHEHSGLLLGAVFIIGVVIPVEIGLGSRREEAE